MKRKKHIYTIFIVFLLLMGIPIWRLYREVQQARLDHALIVAIKAGDETKILEMLAAGANGEARDTGETPTFLEALLNMIDHLRHHGTPPDDSSLWYADSLSDGDAIRLLSARGADLETRDKEGHTPLMGASLEAAKVLLEHGADREARDNQQNTPLLLAIENDDPNKVRLLLEYGANSEARNRYQLTPLIDAEFRGEDPTKETEDIFRILLEHGADREAPDSGGRTPLIWAAQSKQPDMVRILLKNGARVTPTECSGKTALDWVRHESDPDSRKIAALLRNYGAK